MSSQTRTGEDLRLRLCRIALIAVPSLFTSCAAVQPGRTDFLSNYQGYRQASEMDDAIEYQDAGKSLARYGKVVVGDVKVLAPERRQKGEVTAADIAQLEQTFRGTIRREFARYFSIVNSPGPDTLELRAAIVDVRPGDPGFFLIGHAPIVGYASTAAGVLGESSFGAGLATIQGELLDSRTHERLYGLIDRRAGSQLDIRSGLSKWGHVEKAMRIWCQKAAKAVAGNRVRPGG